MYTERIGPVAPARSPGPSTIATASRARCARTASIGVFVSTQKFPLPGTVRSAIEGEATAS
jgi:hypothetical protein